MSRLSGIMGLSGKFGCLCGKWKIIGFLPLATEGSRCRSSSAAFDDSTNFSALVFMVFIIWALHPPL